jgi:hypothetical protein
MEGSAAEVPAAQGEPPLPGLRASDAERDEVVAKLRDEYVNGRLSHETFMYRVNLVLESRRQAELPPFVADLPEPQPGRLASWLRGAWAKVTGTQDDLIEPPPPARRPLRTVTSGMALTPPPRRTPFTLQFPRPEGERFTIGRDASCDLAIADMSVSRQHAQLERTPDGWLLSDLESTNGTRVNGWRVRGQVPVKVGDMVTFGNVEVILTSSADPAVLRDYLRLRFSSRAALESYRDNGIARTARPDRDHGAAADRLDPWHRPG